MRIIDAIYSALEKVTPMHANEKLELRNDAKMWLMTKQKEIKEKPEENWSLVDKLVMKSELWYVRTIIMILYVWFTPRIVEYFHGGGDTFNEEEFEDDEK